MVGAKDLAFPKINLLSWYLYWLGGLVTLVRWCWRSGYGLDIYNTAFDALSEHACRHGGDGSLHSWVLVDLYRAELYRDDPSHAGAGEG